MPCVKGKTSGVTNCASEKDQKNFFRDNWLSNVYKDTHIDLMKGFGEEPVDYFINSRNWHFLETESQTNDELYVS